MKNICSQSLGKAHACGIELKTIWDVQADSSYDVTKKWEAPRNLVAVRTFKGEGRLVFSGGQTFSVGRDSLIVFNHDKLSRYFCPGDIWHFWWFEFDASGVFEFHTCAPGKISEGKRDAEQFRACWSLLSSQNPAQRAFASAIFSAMLHGWTASWEGGPKPSPHSAAIRKVVDLMNRRLDGMSVGEMASAACMGERRFRQVFAESAGKPPKMFYDELRMKMAEALLTHGALSVGEVAERLGFSSQFHFSRAFSEHFGHPPSKLK